MSERENDGDLIWKYLDGELAADEVTAFQQRLVKDPQLAERTALASELDLRLEVHFLEAVLTTSQTAELLSSSASQEASDAGNLAIPGRQVQRRAKRFAVMTSAAALAFLATVFWVGSGDQGASAATSEFNRIIAVNDQTGDRTYQISVESRDTGDDSGPGQNFPPPPPRFGPPPGPPTPSLDKALLSVRSGRQFVLVRQTRDNRPFVTGSDGETSWAVLPFGPVRVSSDPERFARSVPGQQHSVPLINIRQGLEGLRDAYDITLRPIAERTDVRPELAEPVQQLIATRKVAGHPGPRQVEISYGVRSGRIQRMRFVEMPRARLPAQTLRLDLVETRDLGPDFFHHAAHHDPGRPVEIEN